PSSSSSTHQNQHHRAIIAIKAKE
ncbi:conserved hypothetical protein, partial [Trichinella spiralis]